MSRAYNAGTAHVDIKPNLGDFAAELKRKLKSLDPSLAVELKTDAKRLAAEMKATLAAMPNSHDIRVTADTSQATAEMGAFAAAADHMPKVKIDVEADTDTARAKVNSLANDKWTIKYDVDADITSAVAKVKGIDNNERIVVDVDADTKPARRQMETLRRVKDIVVKVKLDTRGAQRQLNALRVSGARGGGMAQFAMMGAAIMALGTAAAGVVAPLAAMSRIAVTAAGSLWVLPAAAGAAAAGIASLMTGLSGIGTAFGAMGKSAGGAAADTSKAMKNAQRAVDDAQRRIEDAYRDIEKAQRRVADAERDLAKAQEESARAQAEVNNARKEAVRELQDMNEQLRDAALDEEGAVLAVARAQQRLQEVMNDPESSRLDIAEADLSYRRAVDSLKDMREEHNRLAESVAQANTAGVEGSQVVTDAHEKVADAQEAEYDAARRLEDAHEGVADAYRKLEDAQRDMADALDRLNEAMNPSGGGGVDAFAEAMAKLSPNAREFVYAIRALGDEWRDVKLAAQDALFEGLGGAITTLAHAQLPQLKDGFVGINTALNKGIRESWAAFSTEVAQADFRTFLGNTTSLFEGLGESMEPLSQIWMDVATVGSEFFPRMGEAISGTMHEWAENINELRESGELADIIERGIAAAQRFGHMVSVTWGVFKNVMEAANLAGDPFIRMMGETMERWEEWTGSTEGQMAMISFFSSATQSLANLYPALAAFGEFFATGIVPFMEKLTEGAGPGLASMFESLTNAMETLRPAAEPIGEAIGRIAEAIGNTIEVVAPVLTVAFTALAKVLGFLAPILVPIAMGVMAIAAAAAPMGIFAGVILKVMSVFGAFKTAIDLVSKSIGFLFTLFRAHPIGMIITAVGLLIAGLIYAYNNSETFRDAVNKLGELLKTGFKWAMDRTIELFSYLSGKVSDVIDWFRRFGEAAMQRMDEAKSALSGFVDNVKELPGKIGKVFQDAGEWLKNAGKNIISGLWDGAREKWGEFTEWLSGAVSPLANGRVSGGRSTRNATGSIAYNAIGSLSRHAIGSSDKEDHSAQYAPAGAWRVWAEPETGGELYIPLANDHRRPRAEALLAAGANQFGMTLIDNDTNAPVVPDYQGGLKPKTQFFAKGGISGADLENFARGVQGKPYVWGGVNWGDCSGAQSALANYAVGWEPFASRFATGNQREELMRRGFTTGHGGNGSFTIGWWNGGPGGGHTASTLPSGINVEMRGGDGGVFGGTAIGANDSRHQQHAHLPADWFKTITIPVDAFGDYDFTQQIGDPLNPGAQDLYTSQGGGAGDSAQPLVDLRNSPQGDPNTYGGDKTPTTWSGIAKNFAALWAEGQTKEGLSILGISDEIPPIMLAAQQYQAAVNKADNAISGRAKTAAIRAVEDSSLAYLEANPEAATAEVPGSAFVNVEEPRVTVAELNVSRDERGDFYQEYDPNLGAEQWRNMMVAAYRNQGYQASGPKIDAWIRQIQSESGGDPNIAQQIVDINGTGEAAGVGLGQMIPSTWAAYRDPNLKDDRRDPWAMTNAMVRYGERKYGAKLLDVIGHGHGYKNGGDVWGAGGPRDDAIFARLSNGEHVTNAASAAISRPLLHAINSDPGVAQRLNAAFIAANGATRGTTTGGEQLNFTYEIHTTNLDEAMRRAEAHGRRQVIAMKGR